MTHRQTGSAQIGAMRTGQQASLPVQVQAPCYGQHSADVIAQSEISQPHSALPQQDVVLQTATACLMHRIPDLTLVADTRIADRHLQDCWYLR